MTEPANKLSRYDGVERNGRVTLRSFDEGVVRTMRAELKTMARTGGFGSNYFITNVPNLSQPPNHPGVPVVFAIPDDVFEEYRIPVVVVQRQDPRPAMQRYHPGSHRYRVPAPGAAQFSFNGRTGYTKTAARGQSIPFDISYIIRVIARNRGGANQQSPRNQANALFMHLLTIFQPYCAVYVEDSIGDIRSYSATAEYGTEDEVLDVTARTIGFTIDLTVEGELDLNQEVESPTVQQYASVTVVEK